MGGSTTVQAPAPAQTASSALSAQVNIAPQQYQATAQYAPQYSDLYSNIAQSSLFGDANSQGLLSTYGQAAPALQNIQGAVNAQQAGQNIGIVDQYASSAVQAYQSANPQLQALQGTLTGLASTPQNPVSQLSGMGQWGSPFASQVGQTLQQNQIQAPQVGASQSQSAAGTLQGYQPNVQQVGQTNLGVHGFGAMPVGAGYNSTVGQLNGVAQQQLALGTSISPQEQATVANQVLSNYNQMGRANDPTAIAGLATGLDTYGQQLLNQRESNAANAGSLQAQQQGLGLAAQQSNQGAGLQAQGLGLQAATTQAGLNQTAGLANQQAALTGSQLNLSALNSQAGLQEQTSLANQAAQQQAAEANQQAQIQAQQANLAAQLQGLGIQGSALQAAGQQQLTAGQGNQYAQLQNAGYQAGLLTTAANLAQQTAVNPYQMILGQSGALGGAAGAVSQAGAQNSGANSLANMYNPFSNGAFNTIYGGQLTASQDTASNNAAITGAAIGAVGSAAGGAAGAMS